MNNGTVPGVKLRLKELRRDRMMTQTQLARAVGISTGYLSQLESGARVPNTRRLEAFASHLGVPITALLTNDSERRELDGFTEIYSQLAPEDREAILHLAQRLLLASKNGK